MMNTKNWGGARPGAGRPKQKERVTVLMNECGWNWMSTDVKYINIDRHYTEKRYWVAPFAFNYNTGQYSADSVDAREAKPFTSLKEMEEFFMGMKESQQAQDSKEPEIVFDLDEEE